MPTVIASHDDALYVSNVTPFPFPAGGAVVWRVSLDGHVSLVTTGSRRCSASRRITAACTRSRRAPAGLPFGARGSGRVVRIGADGSLTPVVTGRTRATGMAFRPGTDRLSTSNVGFGGAPGKGEIVTAHIP